MVSGLKAAVLLWVPEDSQQCLEQEMLRAHNDNLEPVEKKAIAFWEDFAQLSSYGELCS